MTTYKTITAEKLTPPNPHEGIIIDVRTDLEHGEAHLACAHTHAPLDTLNPDDIMQRHGLGKDSAVYMLCRSGKRASQAAEKFAAAGYNNVYVIEGGIVACTNCGQDIKGRIAAPSGTCAKGPISLERQVRIAAGAFAAIGAFLGLTVSAGFTIIPLFVGCGLIFAGVTDRCGMALVLTRAPWNKGVSCKQEKAGCQ